MKTKSTGSKQTPIVLALPVLSNAGSRGESAVTTSRVAKASISGNVDGRKGVNQVVARVPRPDTSRSGLQADGPRMSIKRWRLLV